MKTLLSAFVFGSCLAAGSALATPIVVDSTNVSGTAEVIYGPSSWWHRSGVAPEVTFDFTAGSLTHNLSDYTPGNYNTDLSISGLWFDFNEDGIHDLTLGPISFTSASPLTLGAMPALSGTQGALSWNLDLGANSIWLRYDFDSVYDTTTFSNSSVNLGLSWLDSWYSGSIDGVMNTDFGWEQLTLRLDPVAVPEPSLWLLGGIGLIGFGVSRRVRRKSEAA